MMDKPRTKSANEFSIAVINCLSDIPAGKVIAYGQLAAMAGYPRQARRVAKVLKELPKDTQLAWHRVLRSDGRIAFPIESGHYQLQRSLLTEEGVIFNNNRVIKRHFF